MINSTRLSFSSRTAVMTLKHRDDRLSDSYIYLDPSNHAGTMCPVRTNANIITTEGGVGQRCTTIAALSSMWRLVPI